MAMRISDVASTDLFAGTVRRPLQLIRVSLAGEGGDPAGDGRGSGAVVTVRVDGPGVGTPRPVSVAAPPPGAVAAADVPVEISAPHGPGATLRVTAMAEGGWNAGTVVRAELAGQITVAQPGWTMWMVSHFHYDPVWWNTQGQFTESRLLLPDEAGRMPDVRTVFELVRLHLDEARRDPDYKFVLAEIDYLKPHFDAHPEDRADLLEFIASGRVEIVGGSYNEPNTNLTSAESTIRNAIYGLGYQRDVLGADPKTAWMLDAFGHDPGYPGLMAAAGLTESAWARGPFHQWGPDRSVGDNTRMQFASEFEWVSPDGRGLLTAYMPNHYGAGWVTQDAPDLAAAEQAAYAQFALLAPVAATRNVLLPVGADHVIPSRWATRIYRDWNARYVWPRFVMAVPSEFFDAVRRDAERRDVWITPQTRDMNPVYPGKDVSYIDTKQAQRAAEIAMEDGERLATLAWLAGADYPAQSLDKAWRQLVFGAHHDAITGTEGDQVYLDLLAGWQEAHERGDDARRAAAEYLAGLADTRPGAGPDGAAGPVRAAAGGAGGRAVVVFNTLSAARPGMARITLDFAAPGAPWIGLADESGGAVAFLAEGVRRHDDGTLAGLTLTFRADGVPALGYRTYWVTAAPLPVGWPADCEPGDWEPGRWQPGGWEPGGWEPARGASIENGAFLVEADPARGGTLSRILDKRSGTELLRGPANELVLQEEYDYHPKWAEGPWLLSPKGPGTGSAGLAARVRAERCPVGARLVAEFSLGGLRITQETVLWDSAQRVEFRTHTGGSIGSDRLLRVRFPARAPGALPVYQTALSVIGRPFGSADTDVAQHWYTLDNPAHEWFGLSSAVRMALTEPTGRRLTTAAGVAEVICPQIINGSTVAIRALLAALASQGVTATCSRPDGPRYGSIDLDSNLPDVRIALGGPAQNPFTAEVLDTAGPAAGAALAAQLAASGSARLWIPAAVSREQAFGPGADVRAARGLPVLIVAGDDLAAAIGAVTADLADAVIEAASAVPGETVPDEIGGPACPAVPDLADHSVALLNRGTPSSLVTPDGTLHISLMRSCSGWPCGVWIDGDARSAPDGTSFAWQHWSHTFEYALAAGPGDWRSAGFPLAGLDYNRDLLSCETGLHAGPLPAAASLASAEPASAVLAALKPRGNPLAAGRPGEPRREDGVTARLRDVSGRAGPGPARVRLAAGLAAASLTGPAEEPGGEALPVRDGAAVAELPAAGIVTLALVPRPWLAAGTVAARAEGAALPEPAQPVFTRYWLHGKGPAPAGNLPVAVHLSASAADPGGGSPGGGARIALARPGGEPAALRLTVACGPEPAAGLAELDVPPQLAVEPSGLLRYDLPPRGHASWELRVRALPGAAGRYFLAARISDEAGQLLEDAALVTVGEPAAPGPGLSADEFVERYLADGLATAAELAISLESRELVLPPGGDAEVAVRLANHAASEIRGEAQLVWPAGSWASARPWTRGFAVRPGEHVTLRYRMTADPGSRPGQAWWTLIKIMYFGRLRYTEAIACSVADGSSDETLEVPESTSERR
jgi:Glycosyl hydrolases family 38 N-terminal domain/Alpha mannosidase middle domain/Glycosyl hydrolases family 38 C-terminal domain